jgi:hypothetical protein
MSDFLNQINNINRKLFFKFSKIKVTPDEETKETKTIGEFTGGMGFAQHYGGNSQSSHDTRNAGQNDKPYTTHRPHTIRPDHAVKQRPEKECPDDDPSCKDAEDDNGGIVIDLSKAKEGLDNTSEGQLQEVDEVPEAMPEEPTATEGPPPDDMAGVDDMGDMGGDPAMGDMSDPGLGDPNAGMPGEEPPKDPSELGRTYEMKKIYARLISMNEYLSDEMSPKIMKTKTNIAKAIDLFAVIGANPDSYKDRIDEIIIGYYKFLEAAYRRVKAFYKAEAKEAGGIPLEKNEEQKDDESTMEVTL